MMPTLVELLCWMIMRYWTDETKHMWWVVLSILFVLEDHSRKEYKQPVAYNDPKKESIRCFFQAYNKIGQNSFEVSMAKVVELPFTNILTHVNLAVSDAGNTLVIPKEEHRELQQSVEKVFEQRRSEDYHHRFRILLEHSTQWGHRQWQWKGGSSSWSRAANRGRPAKVHQKTPRNCVRFLNCEYLVKYHTWKITQEKLNNQNCIRRRCSSSSSNWNSKLYEESPVVFYFVHPQNLFYLHEVIVTSY